MGELEKEHRLSIAEKLSYSMGDCAGQIYVTLASFFLTGYYTDTADISAMAIGTMMIVARIFDGTSDLVMGALVDKTNSRYGKARPWILWTAPLMAVALVALFSVPESSKYARFQWRRFGYACCNAVKPRPRLPAHLQSDLHINGRGCRLC